MGLTITTAPFTTVIDKGYIGESLALHLKSENHINLVTIKRTNSKVKVSKQFRRMIFKAQVEELKLLFSAFWTIKYPKSFSKIYVGTSF